MKFKTVTYQRVLSLGNYESKRLELTAEILEGGDLEAEISRLMELVERKVREDAHQQIEEEIRQLKKELRELQKQVTAVKSLSQEEDPDIPFDSQDSGILKGF